MPEINGKSKNRPNLTIIPPYENNSTKQTKSTVFLFFNLSFSQNKSPDCALSKPNKAPPYSFSLYLKNWAKKLVYGSFDF